MDDDDCDFEKASKKNKSKINIFDDRVSLEDARSIIKSSQINAEDDEDEDVINFDDTPVGVKFTNKSNEQSVKVTPMPDLSSLALPASLSGNSMPRTDASNSSYMQFNAVTYGHNRSRSLTLDKNFSKTSLTSSQSSFMDIEEVSAEDTKKNFTRADVENLQKEVLSLKRSLLSAKKDRWKKLPVDETLQRIIRGEVYSLEMYKSLEDKLDLIDKAVRICDGNAITAAVLFFKQSVTSQIFNREILSRPVAANHYLSYLKSHFDTSEYINTLLLLGRNEEAAMYKYKTCVAAPDVSVKISKLRDCMRSFFQNDSQLSFDSSLVEQYIDLLERQRPIEETDAQLESSGKSTLFRDFPRKRSLLDMPVVTTLYYCCLYHYDLGENSLASPLSLKKRHMISDKQFLWTSISARARLRNWKDIEALLTTKSWFGGTKMKAVIAFEKIVNILHRNGAPPDVLDKYISMIDNLEQRLSVAKKVECHKAVVDTLVALKNRQELEQYTSKLERYSKEGLYAHDILNSSTIKWR
ncbi:spermatogenesis-defective protein 39 [Biomphalaria glabrata]|uniref:Spermatogenesis-defective protein 39 homolog isoform X1 n=1 Tax=Biomphalaria glabrata TaxID=6526 RepID=A0A9W2ZXP1_BIOGL|nr:spermatogenesis-defective protein 39 homolog isoform X1 [Biomphalaria glabrata]XP_055879710.1 spermatogenesis-defective protein 39 homolog isoform X1 [Biomphalaria glabrata]XP_055879711.1 spermatogenesis-defective protein 39 homolog isoform X1 [Biomphalaria glabrata]KAI8735313.1 putative spermatogenesis-defective protein 39 [Biomphalaria glabrata]KAI8784597.1 spermatogenesis-defective protein 39 [Biomphalaria glabrata]